MAPQVCYTILQLKQLNCRQSDPFSGVLHAMKIYKRTTTRRGRRLKHSHHGRISHQSIPSPFPAPSPLDPCDTSSWMICPSPGDGHCLLHSVCSAWNSQLPQLNPINLEGVKADFFIETVDNYMKYLPFTEDLSKEILFKGMRTYLLEMKYNQSFGDIAPIITANALKISLIILNEGTSSQYTTVFINPDVSLYGSLLLHRRGDHYNGITPTCHPSESPSCVIMNKVHLHPEKQLYHSTSDQQTYEAATCPSPRSSKNLHNIRCSSSPGNPPVCLLLNTQSVCNKAVMLNDYILEHSVDLAMLTETWLKPSNDPVINEFLPPGYKFLGVCRSTKRGGGVGIVHRSSYHFTLAPRKQFASFEYTETVSTKTSTPLRIIVIYRPPSSSIPLFLDELTMYLSDVVVAYGNLLIVGDFNVHWELPNAPGVMRLHEIINEHDLRQHILTSTHGRGHTLDLVITHASQDLVSDILVRQDHISDHFSILFKLHLAAPPCKVQKKQLRDLRKFDLGNYKTVLEASLTEININIVNTDVETLLEKYRKATINALDSVAPVVFKKDKRIRPFHPWYNDDIHHARKLRRYNEKKWRKSGLEIHRQIFMQHRAEVTAMIVKAKAAHYKEMLGSSDMKSCFQIMDSLLNNSERKLPSSKNMTTLCNDFVSFFCHKVSSIQNDIKHLLIDEKISADDNTILKVDCKDHLKQLKPCSMSELRSIIGSSRPKTCMLDNTPTKIIKSSIDVHLPFLMDIVNASFRDGCFPRSLREAVVTPLIKKANLDAQVMKNYRPVSSTPFLGKIIEKVALLRLNEHLTANGLHEELQSAYKAKHSTETALLKVQHDITTVLDNNQAVLLMMLDLSAAFDCIDHMSLISLLEHEYGVKDLALSWFHSYLTDRRFRVCIDGTSSEPTHLWCGVPQGSVLGPVLFTLYTSPLCRILEKHGVHYHKYADDIQIYLPFNPSKPGDQGCAVNCLLQCFADIRQWMFLHQLKLNSNKTELIYFSSKYNIKKIDIDSVIIGDHSITPAKTVRNLGVVWDNHMSLNDQVTSVCASCNFHLHRLSSIRRYLTPDAARCAVQAFITSRLDYCNSLLLGLPHTQTARLQRIQNKAARFVSRSKKYDHISPVLQSLHWLPILYRIRFKIMVLVYKIINGLAPIYLIRLLQPYKRDSRLRQVHSTTLHEPVSKRLIGKSAFGITAPSEWNKLPPAIRSARTLFSFKNALKAFYFTVVLNENST